MADTVRLYYVNRTTLMVSYHKKQADRSLVKSRYTILQIN